MSLSHLKNAVAEPRRLSAPVARRHVYAASRINRHRARAVANVDTASFEAEVLQADVPVVVDFWAHWCGPCKLIDPVMKQLDADSNGQLKVVKVEVDGNPQLVEKYGVYGLPTLMLFKDGADIAASKREGAIAMKGVQAVWTADIPVHAFKVTTAACCKLLGSFLILVFLALAWHVKKYLSYVSEFTQNSPRLL